MPPPPPWPPQQRGMGPFDDAELRGLYGIHASTPSSELVATLRERLSDVDPNRLFGPVSLPHAATTEIFVRQLQALVSPGAQFSDDLVDAWIWWFNTYQPAKGGVWVPHLGWVHTLIAPPTDLGPTPSTGGRERAVPPPRPQALQIMPYEGLAAWKSRTACDRGRNLTSLAVRYPETARAAPPPRERDPSTIAMMVLRLATTTKCGSSRTCKRATGAWRPSTPSSPRPRPCPTAPLPAPRPAPGPPDSHRVGNSRHLAPRPCPLLSLAVGAAPLATHQGMVSDVEVLSRQGAAVGSHPETDGRDPHCAQPVSRLRGPPNLGAGTGRATAARHSH